MIIRNGSMKGLGWTLMGGGSLGAVITLLSNLSPKLQVLGVALSGLLTTLGGILHPQPGGGDFHIGSTVGAQVGADPDVPNPLTPPAQEMVKVSYVTHFVLKSKGDLELEVR